MRRIDSYNRTRICRRVLEAADYVQELCEMPELYRRLADGYLVRSVLNRSQESVRACGRKYAGSELDPDAGYFKLRPVGRKGVRNCKRADLESATERVSKKHIGMSREGTCFSYEIVKDEINNRLITYYACVWHGITQ